MAVQPPIVPRLQQRTNLPRTVYGKYYDLLNLLNPVPGRFYFFLPVFSGAYLSFQILKYDKRQHVSTADFYTMELLGVLTVKTDVYGACGSCGLGSEGV